MKYMTTLVATLSLVLAACVANKPDEPREHTANRTSPTIPALRDKADEAAMGHDAHDHSVPGSSGSASPPRVSSASSAPPRRAHSPSTEAASPASPDVWTCTMHPEIAKSGAGDCPICGMRLIKRPGGPPAH